MNTSAWLVDRGVTLDGQVSLSLGRSGFSGRRRTESDSCQVLVLLTLLLFESINPEILMDLR